GGLGRGGRQVGEGARGYEDLRGSDDIEDRRDDSGGMGGGGGIGLPMGGGGLGIGTIIVLGLVSYAFGIDPRILIGGAEILTGGGGSAPSPPQRPPQSGQSGAAPATRGSLTTGGARGTPCAS